MVAHVHRPSPEPRAALLGRVIGALFLLGGALGLLTLLLPHPHGSDDRALVAIDVAALGVGLACSWAGARLPLRAAHLAVAVAPLMICATIHFSGLSSGIYATTLFWIVLAAAYFFGRRASLAHLIWLLGCYGIVLLGVDDAAGYAPFTRWLLMSTALAVTWATTSWLAARSRLAEERSERFFELSHDLLCIADGGGRLLAVNPAWTAMLGHERAELLSRPLTDLVHPEDREGTVADLARVVAGGASGEHESRCRAADGSWHWLLWSWQLSPEQGRVYARATDVTDRKRLEDELAAQARTDHLTGLPNRRWLADELERAMARAVRQEFELCLAVIDVDHFKRFNDEHGHPAGDALLRETAEAWRTALRRMDFLARYGGEEFVVVLPDCDLETAQTVVERVRASMPRGQTASAGIAAWTPHEPATELIRRADAALYAAKASGRDRAALAEPAAAVVSAR